MNNSKNNHILIFEYFTASGENDKCISAEAEALIRTLLDDLTDFKVSLIVNSTYRHIAYDYVNVEPIVIDKNLEDYLKNDLGCFSKVIYIAAENNNHLANIAKIFEDKNIFIYNSNFKSCEIASDKFDLFNYLKGIVLQPDSYKVKIDSDNHWINIVKEIYKKHKKIILKPINGVDCENISILENIEDLNHNLFPVGSNIIVQEYVEGEDISVSLIVHDGEVIPLSINKQFIDINGEFEKYVGGCLPYESNLSKEILDVAIKASESLEGLNGFVGVDLRVNDSNVYLIEINSRFTTPYIGLQKIANFNIAKSIIDLIDGNITKKDLEDIISFNGRVSFKKVNDKMVFEVF